MGDLINTIIDPTLNKLITKNYDYKNIYIG